MTAELLHPGATAAGDGEARPRPLVRAVGIVGCALLTAVAARIAVPLPGTAVPFTFQVVAVLLAGFLLGPRLGAASQALYVGFGLTGLPVFAAGGGAAYLFGPTGGYLLAFPAGAALAGYFARERPGVAWHLLGCALAVAAIHASGVAWLAITVGGEVAVRAGLQPFLVGDLLQIALVLLVGERLRGRARRLFG